MSKLEIYKNADIVALPSWFDNFPMTCLEAMMVKGARDRRVVISLQGVIAMAMATISPDLIEVIEEPKKK